MSAKDLIDLNDKDLIKTILENLKNFNTRVRLWQKLSSIHKVNLAQVESIDFIENKVMLRPYKGKEFILAPSPYVYFHSNHRTTLFKTTIKDRGPFRLEIQVPKFVKIQEGRGEDRRHLGSTSTYSAQIKFEGRGKDLKVQVLDISAKGAALSIPRVLFDMVEIGALITICSENVPFLNNQIAIVRNKGMYAPDVKTPNLLKYRVGLEIFNEKEIEDYLQD
jgi:hypothetical protein